MKVIPGCRGEFDHDVLLTRRLILPPRLAFGFSAFQASELMPGSNVEATETGLRLRYEMLRGESGSVDPLTLGIRIVF